MQTFDPEKARAARFANGAGLLVDAGEGAHGQMCRHYGRRRAARELAALAAVWVSHKHADHMLGLPALLAARAAAAGRRAPPLLVVGPAALRDWLAESAAAPEYAFVHCLDFNAARQQAWLVSALGARRMRAPGVRSRACQTGTECPVLQGPAGADGAVLYLTKLDRGATSA
jgi:ribonuclease BN (tRNA processing enzyme)